MPGGNTDPLAASYSLPRSHLTNTRSGVWENADSRIFIGNGFQANTGTADLLTACVVVSSVTARHGMRPTKRLACGQNLWPHHLLLFLRWLVSGALVCNW